MKKQLKENLSDYASKIKSHCQNISSDKAKIVGALATAPVVAAGTMGGACAGGCPFGLVNDPYPGQCGRYIDADGDGICDLSQASAATTTDSSSSSSDSSNSGTSDSSSSSSDSSGVDNGSTSVSSQNDVSSVDGANATATLQNPDVSSGSTLSDTNYHILPISLLLLGGYLFTFTLFKKGILKPKTHKRIWNLLVTFGFVGTGITGVLLTLMINLGISTVYNPQINYLHAELAVIMVIGTIIHLHIYRKPMKDLFHVLLGRNSSNTKSKNKNRKVVGTRGSSK